MKYTYIIRSCNEDMTSRNGFLWPASGLVKADDFLPTNKCGNGLHGLRLDQNDPGQWYENGKILLLKVDEKKIVDLDDKCKFPEAIVIKTFDDMASLTSYLYNKNINIEGMYRRAQISDKSVKWIGGDGSLLTGGNQSILTGGHNSTLTGGHNSTLTGGHNSTLAGGDGSLLTGGYNSTLNGGNRSTLTGGSWSTLTGGYYSTLTGGIYSTLTGGNNSTLTGGNNSTLNGGNYSTITGGDGSLLTGGYYSTLTGGDGSTLSIQYWNGNKNRIAIAYVGENGILPNVKYKVNDDGEFIEVK